MAKQLLATEDQHQLARMVLNSLNHVQSKYLRKYGRDLAVPGEMLKHKEVIRGMWSRWCKNVDRGELRSYTESEYNSLSRLATWTTTKNHEIEGTVPPVESMAEWAICHQAQGVRSVKDLGIIT